MAPAPLRCWVISDGRRGIENQALGLTEALHAIRPLAITSHHIEAGAVFQAASPKLQLAIKSRPEDYGLPSDMPDLVIGCGRQAIAPLMAIQKSKKHSFTAYIQDPRISPDHFDLVIAPEHDGLSGANIETMIGSPNRVTKAKIAGETLQFADRLNALPMPRAAIFIGGTSKTHKLGQAELSAHLSAAQTLHAAGQSLLISTSRRTPDSVLKSWRDLAESHPNIWLYDGQGANPYYAFLGAADLILVTQDSTNMLTEACATGKPVFTLPMAGKDRKFAKLYEALKTRCGVVPWAGQTQGEDYVALNETARIAERVWAHYDAKTATIN